MKKITLALMALILVAGCSPTIDAWADRGLEGLTYGHQNIDTFGERIQKGLDKQKDEDLDAVFEDILSVARGEIEGAELDEEWLEEHKQGFKLLMNLWEKDQAAFVDALTKAHGNLDQVAEAFEQIKRLRRSLGPQDELVFKVDRLADLVARLIAAQKGD